MGIWAEIKYALNSTLGTKDFKPLDEIIRGQKTFIASDDLIANIYPREISSDRNESVLVEGATFTSHTSGAVRLSVQCAGNAASSSPEYPGVNVYEDGVYYAKFTAGRQASIYSLDISGDFIIKPNKTYTFYLHAHKQFESTFSNFKICGTVVDGSLFDYTVGT